MSRSLQRNRGYGPRTGGPSVLPDIPERLGIYAARPGAHVFESYVVGYGLPACRDCFGWSDDPRHVSREILMEEIARKYNVPVDLVKRTYNKGPQ